jgi:hypothetical protein
MSGVLFRCELRGWQQDQISWVLSNYGITEVWRQESESSTDAAIYQPSVLVETANDLPADRELVVLSPPDARFIQGTQSIDGFVHPENPIYMVGGSQSVINVEDLGGRVPDAVVYIPTVKLEMYAFAALYHVLFHRRLQRGAFD